LDDVDDEVRDRAALYLKTFKNEPLAVSYVKEGQSYRWYTLVWSLNVPSESFFSLAALEAKLVTYVNDPSASAKAFDTSSIPKIGRAQAAQDVARKLHYITYTRLYF
jgi:coatomer subunit gamma